MTHDEELKARFRAMQREETRAAPPFAPPAVRRRRVTVPGLVAALALLVLASAWLLLRAPGAADDTFAQLDRTEWVGPTDFLLDLGDRTLLSTIPEIGQYRVPDIDATAASQPREAAEEPRRRS